MLGRTIAIGDIHGCSAALRGLLEAINPGPEDTLVTLGDYIDRGPDSKGVLDLLTAVGERCRLVPLLGNHEELLLASLSDRKSLEVWLRCGGVETVRSYGWVQGGPRCNLGERIPEGHWRFLQACRAFHETDTHLFLHAGYLPNLGMEAQPGETLRWRATDPATALPHCSGKRAVVGHTPQRSGEVLDLGFLVCIDTNCCRGGWLTALDIDRGQIWQADRNGQLRKCPRKLDIR